MFCTIRLSLVSAYEWTGADFIMRSSVSTSASETFIAQRKLSRSETVSKDGIAPLNQLCNDGLIEDNDFAWDYTSEVPLFDASSHKKRFYV